MSDLGLGKTPLAIPKRLEFGRDVAFWSVREKLARIRLVLADAGFLKFPGS